MFVLTLRRLRLYFFVYLSPKFSPSHFNAFRRTVRALGVLLCNFAIFSAI